MISNFIIRSISKFIGYLVSKFMQRQIHFQSATICRTHPVALATLALRRKFTATCRMHFRKVFIFNISWNLFIHTYLYICMCVSAADACISVCISLHIKSLPKMVLCCCQWRMAGHTLMYFVNSCRHNALRGLFIKLHRITYFICEAHACSHAYTVLFKLRDAI